MAAGGDVVGRRFVEAVDPAEVADGQARLRKVLERSALVRFPSDAVVAALDTRLGPQLVALSRVFDPDFSTLDDVRSTMFRHPISRQLLADATACYVGAHELSSRTHDELVAEGIASPTSLAGALERAQPIRGFNVVDPDSAEGVDAALVRLATQALAERADVHDPSVAITASDTRAIRDAAERLESLTPVLARTVKGHVSRVLIVPKATFLGLSFRILPGTIFLGPTQGRSLETVADALFHEALHHYLYDIWRTHPFLPARYVPEEFPYVLPPWNARGSQVPWSLCRVIAACHVYVHLACLRFGFPPECERKLDLSWQVALDRCRYLLSVIFRFADNLGPAGLEFFYDVDTVTRPLARSVSVEWDREHTVEFQQSA